MLRSSLFSVAVLSLFIQPAFAQEHIDPSAGAATPYSDSFSSGEVMPGPPPEQDKDLIDEVNPDQNPDSNPLNDPETNSLPPNFRIGVTGALEIPHIVNFGLDTLMFQKYGVSINRGSVTRNINGVDVSMVHTDLRLRYHPWGGSFFGGVALGQHIMTGEKSKDISVTSNGTTTKVSANVKLTAKANYIAPHIGWFAVWEPGFTMGMDLGWLVPVSPRTTVDDSYGNLPAGAEEALKNTAEYTKLRSDLDDSVQSYAKKSLPFLTMIRLGWMF